MTRCRGQHGDATGLGKGWRDFGKMLRDHANVIAEPLSADKGHAVPSGGIPAQIHSGQIKAGHCRDSTADEQGTIELIIDKRPADRLGQIRAQSGLPIGMAGRIDTPQGIKRCGLRHIPTGSWCVQRRPCAAVSAHHTSTAPAISPPAAAPVARA